MSRERLADAFEELAASLTIAAERVAQVAHEMRAGPEQAAGGASPIPQGSPVAVDTGRCPKHDREWKDGTYGPFCTAKSDDPVWSNKNGFCTINPKNAPKWLEIQRVAA